jgi:hypothetical protein
MERISAQEKRKIWGDHYCTHTLKDRETNDGKETGNYVCVTCRLSMSARGWLEYRKNKTN